MLIIRSFHHKVENFDHYMWALLGNNTRKPESSPKEYKDLHIRPPVQGAYR